MDRKRIIAIIAFTLVSLLLGFALYRVFFAPKIPTTPAPTPGTTTPSAGGQLPTAGEGEKNVPPPVSGQLPTAGGVTPLGGGPPGVPQIARITEDAVVAPTLGKNGDVKFYDALDGKFYRLGPDGKPELLSDQVFYNVQNVTWSPTTDESILEYPDGSNIYYNFATKKQVTLPQHWENFSFSPEGEKIAAKSVGLTPENRWLVAANPDGTDVKLLAALGENQDKVNVDWSPNKQIVATSRTGEPLGADRQQILMIGQNKENFKALIVEGRDFRSDWSPAGSRILYSVYSARSDFKPELWIDNGQGDAIGTGRRLLNVNTWADKCAFADEQTVYCGVPDTLRTGAGFAPQTADNTLDHLYKIDLQSGVRTEIPLTETHVINKIFTGSDGKTLYFTDKNQSGVFHVAL